MHEINTPFIPFDFPVNGFPQNAEVIVSGRSLKGKDGVFVIEFCAGRDIPFHMSFRFKRENILVINTSINGKWQHEERHQNPVFHEQSFVLQIQNQPGQFIIWQKHHKMEFRHRMDPIHRMDPMLITSMRINGEVSIDRIKFERFEQGPQTPYANASNPYPRPQGPYSSAYPQHMPPYSNYGGPSGPVPPYSSNPYPTAPPQGPYSNAPSHPSSQYPPYSSAPNAYGNSQYIGYGASQNPSIGGGVGFQPTPNIGSGTAYNAPFGSGIGFGTSPTYPPPTNYPRPRGIQYPPYSSAPNAYGNSQYIGYGASQNPSIGGGVGFQPTPNIGSGTAYNAPFGSGIGFGTSPSHPPPTNYPRPRGM
uniref:Galectin n=1 Tax=Panagrolaimus sp. PS1159 TaxID=55785 RepID=A0AC35FTT8_9BILA